MKKPFHASAVEAGEQHEKGFILRFYSCLKSLLFGLPTYSSTGMVLM